MLLRLQQWLLAGLSLALLALVITNIMVYQGNLGRQQEVNERQALIQQIQQVELPLYREIAQALTELARRGDGQISYLLSSQGIQVNAPQAASSNQQPQSAAQAPATAPAPQSSEPAADNNRSGRGRGRYQAPTAPATPPANKQP